jgi:hypothetical protein
MASEEETIRAKIQQLTGMFATRSPVCIETDYSLKVRSIDTRIARDHNMHRYSTIVVMPVTPTGYPLDTAHMVASSRAAAILREGMVEVEDQPHCIGIAHLYLMERPA